MRVWADVHVAMQCRECCIIEWDPLQAGSAASIRDEIHSSRHYCINSWHVSYLLQARNLIKAGYSVTVWNRSPEKCKELEGEGASVVASSADCVAASDITIAMLADPPAALAVAKDAVKGISQGTLTILHTHKVSRFPAVCTCLPKRQLVPSQSCSHQCRRFPEEWHR
jgi:hypothetical protein